MLVLRVHMKFSPERCEEAASVLRSLVGPVRAEPRCRSTRLLHGTGGACDLTWIEEWTDVEAFETHLRASTFRRILAVIELASGPPEVEIDDVASRRGFELVEEILSAVPKRQADGLGSGD